MPRAMCLVCCDTPALKKVTVLLSEGSTTKYFRLDVCRNDLSVWEAMLEAASTYNASGRVFEQLAWVR